MTDLLYSPAGDAYYRILPHHRLVSGGKNAPDYFEDEIVARFPNDIPRQLDALAHVADVDGHRPENVERLGGYIGFLDAHTGEHRDKSKPSHKHHSTPIQGGVTRETGTGGKALAPLAF